MGPSARLMIWSVVGLSTGCSPTYDWREARPADGVVALFPCRPRSSVREVTLEGRRVEMNLLSCEAGGSAFAVSRVEVGEPLLGESMLQAMQKAMVSNLSASAPAPGSELSPSLQGLTSTRGRLGGRTLEVQGRGPEGDPMQARGEFFSHRGAIFQATVVGRAPDPQAVDFFFSALKLQ